MADHLRQLELEVIAMVKPSPSWGSYPLEQLSGETWNTGKSCFSLSTMMAWDCQGGEGPSLRWSEDDFGSLWSEALKCGHSLSTHKDSMGPAVHPPYLSTILTWDWLTTHRSCLFTSNEVSTDLSTALILVTSFSALIFYFSRLTVSFIILISHECLHLLASCQIWHLC